MTAMPNDVMHAPRGPNDASTELPWHIARSENMVKVFDANRGYVTQFDLRKFLGAECIERRMKKAQLIAAAPELLAACNDLLQHASLTEHMSAYSVEKARAAVAKAKGTDQ